MKMKFDYYYGNEADQFTFIRIPKILLTHEAFAELSIQAKVLFGILLDRMSLSMRNEWLDEENRVYIIYQIQEIQKDLGFSKKKAMDYLGELEKIGLVEKKRRGLGLPSILYVKSFLSGVEDEFKDGSKEDACSEELNPEYPKDFVRQADEEKAIKHPEENKNDSSKSAKSAENGTSRSVDLGTSGTDKEGMEGQIFTEDQGSRTGKKETNRQNQTQSTVKGTASGVNSKVEKAKKGKISKNKARGVDLGTSRSIDLGTSRSVDLGTSRGAEIALQEVPTRGPLKNNTNIINTYKSDTESNLISSGENVRSPEDDCDIEQDQMGADEMPSQRTYLGDQDKKSKIKNTLAAYRSLILENVSYDCLKERYPYDGELLEGIVEIMLEAVMNQGDYMQIASATYPTELVKSRFLKLDCQHIQYVVDCFNKNTTKVGNIKKYLMAALFNAPSTIGGYYTAEVHHDMPYLARG